MGGLLSSFPSALRMLLNAVCHPDAFNDWTAALTDGDANKIRFSKRNSLALNSSFNIHISLFVQIGMIVKMIINENALYEIASTQLMLDTMNFDSDYEEIR